MDCHFFFRNVIGGTENWELKRSKVDPKKSKPSSINHKGKQVRKN